MEFGAAICTSRNPRCEACPVSAGCPSRGLARIVPVPRQAAFAGSDRAHRGAILRALSRAPDHRITLVAADDLVPSGAVRRVLAGLERDRLVHRSGARLVLGGATEAAATIGR
jgi:A/G-specific adenine glycosylase